MTESFVAILAEGNKRNTLGRADEVVQAVLNNKSRLDELYNCLFTDDAWIRMRAVDSFEKVCRVHPEWFVPYVDRLLHQVAAIDQPSIQWHLAQMFNEISLSPTERSQAIHIMEQHLSTTDTDWIVASNCMATLASFVTQGYFSVADLSALLTVQQHHHSKAVVKRATKLLNQIRAH